MCGNGEDGCFEPLTHHNVLIQTISFKYSLTLNKPPTLQRRTTSSSPQRTMSGCAACATCSATDVLAPFAYSFHFQSAVGGPHDSDAAVSSSESDFEEFGDKQGALTHHRCQALLATTMISMNRMSAMLVSMKQTIFAIMFLMSETTTESELGTRGKFISVCLMFIDFLQVACTRQDASCTPHLSIRRVCRFCVPQFL